MLRTHRLSLIKLAALVAAMLVGNIEPPSAPGRIGGAGKERIVSFGMVTALSGPAAGLGLNMRAGVLAAFEEANRNTAGDVSGGPSLRLVIKDDGYEPSRTGPAVRELIEKEHIVAFVGNVGTPTGVVALPICRETGTLFIAPFSGAAALRTDKGKPVDSTTFHFRASYGEETEAMVQALVEYAGVAIDEIAVFSQRDAYGDAGYNGVLNAARARGLPSDRRPLHVRYERNTLDVEAAVAECLGAAKRPRAVIMVGTYAPSAAFIRTCLESEFIPLFLNVSFVGAEALAGELGEIGDGVVVTQVVPTLDAKVPVISAMTKALAGLPETSRVEPSLGALEGYIAGRLVVAAIGRIEGPTTSQSLAKSLESLASLDVGLGVNLSLSASDHQACHQIWPSVLRKGKVTAFSWTELGTAPRRPQAHAEDPQ